jgi:hypothetical protein
MKGEQTMPLQWTKVCGDYIATGKNAYCIKRNAGEQLYYPYVNGQALVRPRSTRGFFVLAEAKGACEKVEAA